MKDKSCKFSYISQIEALLTEDEKDMLKSIYAPTVVATPLNDSRRDICIMPDGERRSYGTLPFSNRCSYMSSSNAGLSWELHYARGMVNSCTYFEDADIYITQTDTYNNNNGLGQGLWVLRSKIGPDDPDPEVIHLSDDKFVDSYLPQKSAYSDRIWFTAQCIDRKTDPLAPTAIGYFFYSDDYGKTWTRVKMPSLPEFEVVYPHKGLRWSKASGAEPYAIEISEDKMMMIIRSPHDSFYLSYSYDRGESWTEPEPSDFYGTNTTAQLLTLSDGRIMCFWNNTRPLAEPNHDLTLPPVRESVKIGASEDAFTNRDAAHAAISEDGGKTFIGYREILLNPIRNNTDFRYVGGIASSNDKSVHQFQAFELPYGKILVSVGQHQSSRRLLIFDIEWLYETEASEDFIQNALSCITTHTYVKSVSDCQIARVGNGHCAWNRAPSAYLMPDPDGGYGEALSISKHHDERLINDIGGTTWNFPTSKRGIVSIEIKIVEKEARFILSDRWYNTCDPHAAIQSHFSFELDKDVIGDGFATVDIYYNTEKGFADVSSNGTHLLTLKMTNPCPVGISYLVLQCDTDGDSKGFYIKSLKKQLN